MQQGMIRGDRALASLVIGAAISAVVVLGGWLSSHVLGITMIPGLAVAGQIRHLLNVNLPVVIQLMLMTLLSTGLLGLLVYTVWTIIAHTIRRRQA